jgi:hypothetical protein
VKGGVLGATSLINLFANMKLRSNAGMAFPAWKGNAVLQTPGPPRGALRAPRS